VGLAAAVDAFVFAAGACECVALDKEDDEDDEGIAGADCFGLEVPVTLACFETGGGALGEEDDKDDEGSAGTDGFALDAPVTLACFAAGGGGCFFFAGGSLSSESVEGKDGHVDEDDEDVEDEVEDESEELDDEECARRLRLAPLAALEVCFAVLGLLGMALGSFPGFSLATVSVPCRSASHGHGWPAAHSAHGWRALWTWSGGGWDVSK